MGHRYVCIHAHFHQPQRENPWTGDVERESAAAPFHNINELASEECYGPLALGARIGSDGRTIAFESLLRRLSFGFGPPLLSWLERRRPTLYRRVIEADQASAASDGLGNAVAEPYVHAVLPLLSRRDKETLTRWGIADFTARYGRKPAGFWLPEGAVDEETLDVLAAEGLQFTFLDPSQAGAVRLAGADSWRDIDAETLDPKTPYRWRSAENSSHSLAIFFRHRALSLGAAEGTVLADAPSLAQSVQARLMPGDAAQMAHLVSEGEVFGRLRPGAEGILSLGLDLLSGDGVAAINPARFLKLFPPPQDVRLHPRTSWSCPHGLARWERDCGCRSTYLSDWNQEWRAPLREALDQLACRLDAFYESEAGRVFEDPWKARDASISLWLDPRPPSVEAFMIKHAKRPLPADEEAKARRLFVLQRERLAMLASDGLSYDDISCPEAVQVLQRAARAVELARSLGADIEEDFVTRLASARSNVAGFDDGAKVYRRLASSARTGIDRAAAHVAILDHVEFEPHPNAAWNADIGPTFRVDKKGLAGRERSLSARRVRVARPETLEIGEWNVVVHRADRLDFACWLAPLGPAPFDPAALGADFLRLSDDDFRAAADALFGAARFGLDAVLPDERSELALALFPEGGLGPERALFLKRWTEAIMAVRKGGSDDDALLELLRTAYDNALPPEHLPWAHDLPDLLHTRLEKILSSKGDPADLSRALRWLDALWETGLLNGAWRLRDFQRRWSDALSSKGPSAEKDACRALGRRLGLAEPLLEASRW